MPPPVRFCDAESTEIGRQFVDLWSQQRSLLNADTDTSILRLFDLLEEVRKKWQNCELELQDERKKRQESELDLKAERSKRQICEVKLLELKRKWKNRDEEEASTSKILLSPRFSNAFKDNELDQSPEWKNVFQYTPKRRQLLHNQSSPSFNGSSSAPLATLDEEESESKENLHEKDETMEDEASTSQILCTPPRFRMRRSLSVPLLNKSMGSPGSDDGNSFKLPRSPTLKESSPPRQYGLCLDRIDRRAHIFERRRVFTKTVCSICTANIRFGIEAVKCTNCKSICHQHCSRRITATCVPWAAPLKSVVGRLRLGDYCSASVVPKIPHLIVRCVQYLNTEKSAHGIYTNYNRSGEVDLLLQLILHERVPPDFKSYGPHLVAHCILKFLSDLRESLIPESSFREFADAAKEADNFDLEAVISELPIVHKNTLAYLFVHWKLLNEHSDVNGLTDDVLARAIIPFIMVGTAANLNNYLPVFSRLLLLTDCFWENLIEEGFKLFAKTPLSRSSSKKVQTEVSRSITVAKLQQSGMRRF